MKNLNNNNKTENIETTEIWKDVKGYEGIYQVSNLGRIKTLERTIEFNRRGKIEERVIKERILTGEKRKANKKGQYYKRISLIKDGILRRVPLHRVILETFVPNPNNLPVANHLDGNPENNRLSNLEWCTHSENELHSYRVLKKINGRRKLTFQEAQQIRKEFKGGRDSNANSLAEKYGVTQSTIYNIVNKKTYVTH